MSKSILLLAASLFSTICAESQASEWRLLETDYLAFEAHALEPERRDPYLPQHTGNWANAAHLKWESTLVGRGAYSLGWNHNIHTETVKAGNVKSVGWEWEVRLTLGRNVELFQAHHSRHVMEELPRQDLYPGRQNKFPVSDSYGVRFIFVPRKGQ